MLKIFKKNINLLSFLGVIFFGFLAARTLIGPGYFNMHDDLQMMRQLEMEKCFKDLQIPCRWVPDMGYGFGFPLFNYYPPLPYLIGEIFRVLGFSFVAVVKILFVIALVFSGITMFYLAKELFGNLGGLIASVFYIWAPYHAVDIFVRGAMNESWALIWFPAILLFSFRLIKDGKPNLIILLSLSWFGLLVSHNLMVLIFAPVFGTWCLYWLIVNRSFYRIRELLISGFLAFGLAAFFTLPVFVESKLVQTNTLVQGYYEYIAHFATIKQLLFSRFWGYGPSVWLEEDRMSFQVGYLHWIVSLVVFVFLIFKIVKKSKSNKSLSKIYYVTLIFIIIGWFSAFMAHLRSSFIWSIFPPLKFVQFPWRFLTIVTLMFSLAAGSLVILFTEKKSKIIAPILIIGVILLNFDYFKPEHGKLGVLTDEEKFDGAAWELQQTAGIYDYLPVAAKEAPKAPRKSLADIVDGRGNIVEQISRTNRIQFKANLETDGVVRINVFKFPNWRIFADGVELKSYIQDGERWGLMYINLSSGEHIVYAKLFNTPVRTLGNLISFISWLGLMIFVISKWKTNI